MGCSIPQKISGWISNRKNTPKKANIRLTYHIVFLLWMFSFNWIPKKIPGKLKLPKRIPVLAKLFYPKKSFTPPHHFSPGEPPSPPGFHHYIICTFSSPLDTRNMSFYANNHTVITNPICWANPLFLIGLPQWFVHPHYKLHNLQTDGEELSNKDLNQWPSYQMSDGSTP